MRPADLRGSQAMTRPADLHLVDVEQHPSSSDGTALSNLLSSSTCDRLCNSNEETDWGGPERKTKEIQRERKEYNSASAVLLLSSAPPPLLLLRRPPPVLGDSAFGLARVEPFALSFRQRDESGGEIRSAPALRNIWNRGRPHSFGTGWLFPPVPKLDFWHRCVLSPGTKIYLFHWFWILV